MGTKRRQGDLGDEEANALYRATSLRYGRTRDETLMAERVAGYYARLLKMYRRRADWSQQELAALVGKSRTWIGQVECCTQLPTMENAVALARAAKAPIGEMTVAWTRDSLSRCHPEEIAAYDAELDGRKTAWDKAAAVRLRVAEALIKLTINADRKLSIDRSFRRCTLPVPRPVIVFRDRRVGRSSSRIEVTGADHEITSKTSSDGEWRIHTIKLDDGAELEPMDIRFRVDIPDAFTTEDVPGDVMLSIAQCIEHYAALIRIDPSHSVELIEPIASVDAVPLEDCAHVPVSEIARRASWKMGKTGGRLTMIRPLPGFGVAVRWRPNKR